MEYNEIQELYRWCQQGNIPCTIAPLFDGWKITFADGADIVQHIGSYGGQKGCLEPCGFGEKYDYTPIALIYCWILVKARYR